MQGFAQILSKLFVSVSESKISRNCCVCAYSVQATVERVPVISSLLGKKLDLMKARAMVVGFSPGWSDSLTLKQESCHQPEQKGTRKLRQKDCQLS